MLTRLVIFLLLIFAGWYIWRNFLRPMLQAASNSDPQQGEEQPKALPMSRCDHCGLHLPDAEAIHEGDKIYCCEAHRQAAQK